MSLPSQVSDPGCAGLRHGPEPPHFLARLLVVCRDEPVGAVLTARHAGDHQVSRGQRRRGRRVVLSPVVQLRVPQQVAGETVQRDDVRAIGLHEHAIAGDGNPTVDAVEHARRLRMLVTPDLAPGAGIERVALVERGHIHDAAHDCWGDLRAGGARDREHPLRCQVRHVRLVDRGECGVAVPPGIAVIGRPVAGRGDLPDVVGVPPQQGDAAVIGQHLEIVEPFGQHLAGDGLAGGGLQSHSDDRLRVRTAFESSGETSPARSALRRSRRSGACRVPEAPHG